MYMIIQKNYLIFLALLTLSIAACSDSDSSSETSTSSSTPSDLNIRFDRNSITAGEAIAISYNLDNATQLTRSQGRLGTIFWGDSRTTEISGSGTARHTYKFAGTYNIDIQVEGEERQSIGRVTVNEPEPEVVASTPFIPTSADVVCAGATQTIKSASTGRTYNVSLGAGASATVNVTDLTTGEATTNITTAGCPAGSTGAANVVFAFPTAPSVTFTFQFTNGSLTFNVSAL